MQASTRCSRGFTLLEVSFATGILFLTFVLLLGAMAHMARVREVGERKHLATVCLRHCLERIAAEPNPLRSSELLTPPRGLPGEYTIEVGPSETSGLVEVRVVTHTTHGQMIEVAASVAREGGPHAP